MQDEKNSFMTFAVVIILVISALAYVAVGEGDDDHDRVNLSHLMASRSTRSGAEANIIVVSADDPNYALIATPVALYYDNDGVMRKTPLLVADSGEPSTAVEHFVSMYPEKDITTVGEVGDVGEWNRELEFDGESLRRISIDMALEYWEKSDGAVIVHNSQLGYNFGVPIVPLASYLNIPVFVIDRMNGGVERALDKLGVEYTITCGPVEGYGRVWRVMDEKIGRESVLFSSYESYNTIIHWTRAIIEDRLGLQIDYLTAANPLDTYEAVIEDEEVFTFNGTISDSASGAYPGAAPDSPDGPICRFQIPEDYDYALVEFDVKMDVREATGHSLWTHTYGFDNPDRNADDSGERIYIYVGKDGDDDGVINGENAEDTLSFFGGSPGYDFVREGTEPTWAHAWTTLPYIHDTGDHDVQLLARLPTDYGANGIPDGMDGDGEALYHVQVTVKKVQPLVDKVGGIKQKVPVFRLMEDASAMAPYLTAYHHGLILAKPQYILHDTGYIGCSGCGEPAANENALSEANEKAAQVKKDINHVLGMLAGIDLDPRTYYYSDEPTKTIGEDNIQKILDLAEHYQNEFYAGQNGHAYHLAIVADSNMFPQYYHESKQGDPTEGFGIAGDNVYMSIDADPYDDPYELVRVNSAHYDLQMEGDPDFEIASGRVDGWDLQDVSALVARSTHYEKIVDSHKGPSNGYELPDEWKNAAYTTLGSLPPVEVAKADLEKFRNMARAAGFECDHDGDAGAGDDEYKSRRQWTQRKYESANFIFFCAHGFYYWYVPTAIEGVSPIANPVDRATYGGGAYDVAHVKDMDFGPTVIFGSSCVTGRTDGIPHRIALSQAFLHAGVNAYIGASRMSWGTLLPLPDQSSDSVFGDYIALIMYGALFGKMYDKQNPGGIVDHWPSNATVGAALMDAKNKYVSEWGTDGGGPHTDTINEFFIHGDPAFNPYEPNHEGA